MSRDGERFRFFFNDTATTEIYTLSLHDALPIFGTDFWVLVIFFLVWTSNIVFDVARGSAFSHPGIIRLQLPPDRKSTRLNSSHANISYAVFCLKKNKRLNLFFPPNYSVSLN